MMRFYVLMCGVLLCAGCTKLFTEITGFEDYRVTPPDIILWSKEGIYQTLFEKDRAECYQRYLNHPSVSAEESLDVEESCFLEKGYCFTNVQKRSLWRNYCAQGQRADGPACKSQGQRVCPPALKSPDDYSFKSQLPSNPQLAEDSARIAHELVEKRLNGEIGDPARTKPNAVPVEAVSIAPSENPATTLQDQVQKDSNSQMNQLLQGTSIRK